MGSDEIKLDQIRSCENRRYQMILDHISWDWLMLYYIWFHFIRPDENVSDNIEFN